MIINSINLRMEGPNVIELSDDSPIKEQNVLPHHRDQEESLAQKGKRKQSISNEFEALFGSVSNSGKH